MIQTQTLVGVADNSGVRTVRCVHLFRKPHSSVGTVGCLFLGVIVSLKRAGLQKSLLKKGDLALGLLVNTSRIVSYNCKPTGIYLSFSQNLCVLLDRKSSKNSRTLLGSRVSCVAPYLLRQKGFFKAYSLTVHHI